MIERGFLPVDGFFPFRGLNSSDPSTFIDPRLSPLLKNVEIRQGVLEKRRGYLELPVDAGVDGGGGSKEGTVVGLVEWEELAAGAKRFALITTTKQYAYDAANVHWDDITGTSGLTGAITDDFDSVVAQDATQKMLIITNSIDRARWWDGALGVGEAFTWYRPDLGSGLFIDVFHTCEMFYNRLVVGNVTSGGTASPKSVFWSTSDDIDAATGWTPVDAGTYLVADLDGDIRKLLRIGDRMAIYSDGSIALMTYLGAVYGFGFEIIVQDIRLVDPQTIVSGGGFHFFLSKEGFFAFDGSRNLLSLSEGIDVDLRDQLDFDNITKAIGFHDLLKQRVFWVVVMKSETRVYQMDYEVNNLRNPQWTIQVFADAPTAFSYFTHSTSVTYGATEIATLTYADAAGRYSDYSASNNKPSLMFGSGTQAFLLAETESLDNGSTITYQYDTKDFAIPQAYRSQLGRWQEIELEMQGVSVDVQYSTSLGSPYVDIKTQALSASTWTRYKIPIDVTSQTIRIRLKGTEIFKVRWLRLWFTPAGER